MIRYLIKLPLLLLLVACAAGPSPAPLPTAVAVPTVAAQAAAPIPAPTAVPHNPRVPTEDRYQFGLAMGFDAILPIYEPQFTTPAIANLDPNELVLGIAWGGAAKAYPIRVLHFRELVNDELAGVPTLVSW
jgi:hypothetical protein